MTLDSYMEKETLPASEEELTIPTQVSKLDVHLKFLKDNLLQMEQQIKDAEFDRLQLLKRAKELNITTDKEWKIVEVPVYPKKRVDVEKLKRLEPDRYKLILANIRSRIQDKINAEIDKADTFISQADVKNVIRDKVTLSQVIPEPTKPIGYEITVVKRG